LRLYSHTICVRLSDEDNQRYLRLLRRYGSGFRPTKSESFRKLLERLDIPHPTIDDNEDWDWYKEQPREESSEESTEEPIEEDIATL
jgi:hypothetical protein